MKKIKYLIVIPALAAILFLFPAAERAYAGGSVGFGFSFSVPYYDPYPTYYYPYGYWTGYGWWDDRPYWRGRYPRHYYYYPRHYRPYGRHHYYDRHDHRWYRGYDRW